MVFPTHAAVAAFALAAGLAAGGCYAAPCPDAAAACAAGDAAGPRPDARPTTATFGERPGSTYKGVTTDTWLEAAAAAAMHGSDGSVYAQDTPVRVALVRFDVSAVPPGSTVMRARLRLFNGSMQEGGGTLHAVPDDWIEDEASWAEPRTGTPWSATPDSWPSMATFSTVATYRELEAALPIAVAQAWVDDQAANHGIEIRTPSPNNFRASEYPDASLRPQLDLDYLAP